MVWPTGGEYQIALQSARISFGDPDLKAGQPELNQLGLPKPRSGSYAVAFKVRFGKRDYAVRCFLSDSLDRQDRYQKISDFLRKAALSYTVDFSYQREGILVGGKWYPILKMEWVQGDSLGAYVAKNVTNPQNLIALAGRWVEMSNALNAVGMAHGDLQHGNVLIMPDGQIKLIDYDGMYIPALAGRPSEEIGQRNYQHPLRTAMDFGPNLDHFSEWVIYVSLVLLSLDPTLWINLKGGDECLLFRKTDFDDPENSLAFKTMERAKDSRVRSLAEALRSLLYFAVSQMPRLDVSGTAADLPLITSTPAQATTSSAGGSSWLADHVQRGPAVAARAAGNAAPSRSAPSAAWILDYLRPPAAPQRFTNPLLLERVLLGASALLFGLCVYFFPSIWPLALGLLALSNLLLMSIRYSRQEIVHRAHASARKVAELRHGIENVSKQIASIDEQKAEAAVVLQQQLERIIADRNRVHAQETDAVERVRAQLKVAVYAIDQARKNLADSDAKDLNQLQQGLGARLLDAQKKLAAVDQSLLKELDDTLAALQRQHVSNAMNGALLERASISGVGPGRRASLRAVGIRSAADVQRRGLAGISGIGPTLQSALRIWSRAVEADATRTRPAALIPANERSIRDRYSTSRIGLTAQRDELQRAVAAEQARIASMRQTERSLLDQQKVQAQTKMAEDLGLLHKQHQPKYQANEAESIRARADIGSRVLSLDQQVQELRTRFATLNWQMARLEHEHATFRAISLKNYARRAIWPLAG